MARLLSISIIFSFAALAENLPQPEPPFHGVRTRDYQTSKPDFPSPVKAPAGAPNILIVLLDDTGFGQSSTFGGPIPTPTLDRLAKNGLRYNQFHTTALCSPTRAALLTGRNHHAVGAGTITELATGYPGYNAMWPQSAASIAEILKYNGYSTAAFGKWHNTPDNETSSVGPFDRWPTGKGFEYFYGFLGGETNQWSPSLVENVSIKEKPNVKGYHLTTDLADTAIGWIRYQQTVAPDKPFFAYFAPGATHAPHQVPKEWIQKFAGHFDQGWDKVREETFARQKALGIIPQNAKLTPRPEAIQSWDSLSPDEKRLFARMQEVYAGFLAQTDHETGRVIDAIEQLGKLDNTLIIYISGDNGPSAEGGLIGSTNENLVFNGITESLQQNLKMIDELGGPMTYNHYPAGWAHAGSTPFKWVKQVASHFGGVRNPLVISWPQRIQDRGGLRSQFHHVIDVVPTILEATHIPTPALVNGIYQTPIEGTSMVYTFDHPQSPSTHKIQYFEMFANRALYQDGWIASAFHGRLPWTTGSSTNPDKDIWELYNLNDDFTQNDDLAAQNPAKLKQLQDLFVEQASKYNVFPLDDRTAARFDVSIRPGAFTHRNRATLYPGIVRLPEGSAPDFKNRSFVIAAEVKIPKSGAEGVLLSEGGRFGGFSLYVQNGKLHFTYNFLDTDRYTVNSNSPLPTGDSTLRVEFSIDGSLLPGRGGLARLFVNDKMVGEGRIEKTIPFRIGLGEGLDVGKDTGTPVTEAYQTPFAFNGTIQKIDIKLGPTIHIPSDQEEMQHHRNQSED